MRYFFAIAICIVIVSMSSLGVYRTSVVGGGDSWGYYAYLPATFIHHDLTSLDTTVAIRSRMAPKSVSKDSQGRLIVGEAHLQDSKRTIKYTYGIALFHLPAFAVAHLYCVLSSTWAADGYSMPYILSLYLSTIFFVFLGMYFLQAVLRRYFDRRIVLATLVAVLFCTNLFYFSVSNNVMSHPIMFMLYCLLLYATDTYYREPTLRLFLTMAFCVGMITVIRPTEVWCLLIPLLYSVDKPLSLVDRIRALWSRPSHIWSGVAVGVLCILPQLVYWKLTSGEWLHDSYPDESFDFTDPKILRGLFGFQNGFFAYTPIMCLALLGFFLLKKVRFTNAILLFVIIAINVYIMFSWWNWYYINSYGLRTMVDLYPLWAFPLAAAFKWIDRKLSFIVVALLLLLSCAVNVFQTYQHYKGIIRTSLSNAAFYRQAFGKLVFDQEMSIALDLNTYQAPADRPLRDVYFNDFENDSLKHARHMPSIDSKVYHITKSATEDVGLIVISYSDLVTAKGRRANYLYFDMKAMVEKGGGGFYDYDSFVFKFFKPNGKSYDWRFLRLNNKTGVVGDFSIWGGKTKVWTSISGRLDIPKQLVDGHRIQIEFLKKKADTRVYIDDLRFSVEQ